MARHARIQINGATVVTGRGRRRTSLSIVDGRIADVGPGDWSSESVDADGLLLLPGFVDTHVHLMEPAAAEREDWVHGTAAAAASGVTTIVEHTHADPVRSADDLAAKREWVSGRSLVDYALAAHAWPDRIADVRSLWASGAAFLKVFTCTTHGVPGFSPGALRTLLEEVAACGATCLVHCEDESLTATAEAALRASGRADGAVIPEWRNREAERIAVFAVADLARVTGARVAIAHASSPEVLQLIAAARSAGAPVVAESCPQYFSLFEDEVLTEGGTRKFTPPARARTEDERAAMWRALETGAVHHMSSDHAPATLDQKAAGSIWDVHFGLPGLDTTSSILIDAAARGLISWERLANAYAEAPARWYGLRGKGSLGPGADADFVLIDPTAERVLSNSDVKTKAGWTPYEGTVVRGSVVATYLRGCRLSMNRTVERDPGFGRFIAGPGASSAR